MKKTAKNKKYSNNNHEFMRKKLQREKELMKAFFENQTKSFSIIYGDIVKKNWNVKGANSSRK